MSAVEAEEWFTLPDVQERNTAVSAEMRRWVPGDGLTCRSANLQKSIPCTAPVVTMRSKSVNAHRLDIRPTVRTSVYCAHHAASAVRRQLGEQNLSSPTPTTEITRAAQEQILTAHWDEYQDAVRQAMAAHQEKYLGMLPDWLRESMLDAEAASA